MIRCSPLPPASNIKEIEHLLVSRDMLQKEEIIIVELLRAFELFVTEAQLNLS